MTSMYEEISRKFQEAGGFDKDRADTLAQLAVAQFNLHEPQHLEVVYVAGDGIEDGITRSSLLDLILSTSYEPGGTTKFRYRGLAFTLICDSDGLSFESEDSDWPLVVPVKSTYMALQAIRDLDFWVSIVQADLT